jgi:hypothetical protein
MTTLHVMLNEQTNTPLEDIMRDGLSGTWRVTDENMEAVTKIAIWDKVNQRKLATKITGWTQTDHGKVIEFNPGDARMVDVFWANRPKFNRIGFVIR